jgi:homospermidine synthase
MNKIQEVIDKIKGAKDTSKRSEAVVEAALDELPNLSHEDVEMVDNGQPGETEPQLPAEPSAEAKETFKFDGCVVFFGFGGVAECTLPILMKHLEIEPERVLVIDMLDKSDVIKKWTDIGVTFIQLDIVEKNFKQTMAKYLEKGDILIDVCYDISCVELIRYCREHKILYVNTSVEEWSFFDGFDKRTPYEKSLYARQQELDEEIEYWGDNEGTTAVLDMGANPGLISHFMKQGLLDLAKKKGVSIEKAKENEPFAFANLAKKLGVKVVLDTERDTQIGIRPKEVDEFVGTWSVLGLVEEATSPVEMGWGTHETKIPENATIPNIGPKNQIFLSQMGMHTFCRGFVPADPKDIITKGEERTDGYEIIGNNIRHGEAYSISKFLTTEDGSFRPTVYYCYMPSDVTVASLR